jgi:DNA adenine methylase
MEGCVYAEPFAGGGGVAVDLLLAKTVSHILLNDIDVCVVAFWRSVISQNAELCRRISRVALSVEEWRRQREIFRTPHKHSQIDVAFSFLYLNRVNRSGILNAGLIGGIDQSGPWKMDARFPRRELINRIETIGALRSKITVSNCDAELFLSAYLPPISEPTLVYCDPPYFKKADRLYTNFYLDADHEQLAKTIQKRVEHKWVVSYDNCEQINALYKTRQSFTYSLRYNASSSYLGSEAFFLSDNLSLPTRCGIASIDEGLMSLRAA